MVKMENTFVVVWKEEGEGGCLAFDTIGPPSLQVSFSFVFILVVNKHHYWINFVLIIVIIIIIIVVSVFHLLNYLYNKSRKR